MRLFVAIDRTSKFAFVELHQEAGKMVAAQFLRNLVAAVPYTIHTVLTDDGIQFRARIEHVFARQKDQMALFIRTIGIARAETKIGLANLVYNIDRLVFHERRGPWDSRVRPGRFEP